MRDSKQKITVTTYDSETIKSITTTDQLALAQKVWESLVPLAELPMSRQPYPWTHKLLIEVDSKQQIWLYDSKNGCVAALNYTLKPAYQVGDVKKFNKIFISPSEAK